MTRPAPNDDTGPDGEVHPTRLKVNWLDVCADLTLPYYFVVIFAEGEYGVLIFLRFGLVFALLLRSTFSPIGRTVLDTKCLQSI